MSSLLDRLVSRPATAVATSIPNETVDESSSKTKATRRLVIRKNPALSSLVSTTIATLPKEPTLQLAAAHVTTQPISQVAPAAQATAQPITPVIQAQTLPEQAPTQVSTGITATTNSAKLTKKKLVGARKKRKTKEIEDEEEPEEETVKPRRKASAVSKRIITHMVTPMTPMATIATPNPTGVPTEKISERQYVLLENIINELKQDKLNLQNQVQELTKQLMMERQKQDMDRQKQERGHDARYQALSDTNAAMMRHVITTQKDMTAGQNHLVHKLSSSVIQNSNTQATLEKDKLKAEFQQLQSLVQVWDPSLVTQHLNTTYQCTPQRATGRLQALTSALKRWKATTSQLDSNVVIEVLNEVDASNKTMMMLEHERAEIERALTRVGTSSLPTTTKSFTNTNSNNYQLTVNKHT